MLLITLQLLSLVLTPVSLAWLIWVAMGNPWRGRERRDGDGE